MSEKTPFKGSWERPVKVDPASVDPFTLARMTDHNVHGVEESLEPELAEAPVPSPAGEPIQKQPKNRDKAA